MPQFKFHVSGDPVVAEADLPNLAAAKRAAIKLTGSIISEQDAVRFWDDAEWTMTVCDERGLALFQITVIATDAPVTRASARPSASPPS